VGRIVDRETEPYPDWCFATSLEDIGLGNMIVTYKKRWRMETGPKVQDEARIKTKLVDIWGKILLVCLRAAAPDTLDFVLQE
jgi:hypothetical protein